MVLPEVICGFRPVCSVAHLVSFCHVIAICIACKVSFGVVGEMFIERVIASQSHVVKIFVGFDACFRSIGAVHERKIVVSCRHSIPSLPCFLKVADVLISDDNVVRHPADASVVGT